MERLQTTGEMKTLWEKAIFVLMAIFNHIWSFFYFTLYFYFFPFTILVILNIFSEDPLEF